MTLPNTKAADGNVVRADSLSGSTAAPSIGAAVDTMSEQLNSIGQQAKAIAERFAPRGDSGAAEDMVRKCEEKAAEHRKLSRGQATSVNETAYKDYMAASRFYARAAKDPAWLGEAARAFSLAERTGRRAAMDEPNGPVKSTPQAAWGAPRK